MGALSHIRVLDLSRVLAGPWGSQILADLGADVIKVEHPHGGDESRAWGPPFARREDGTTSDVSAYFLCTNRNKKSVTIDLAQHEGQDIVRRLAQQSDVVIENFKVGGLAQYGLDYASLSTLNSRLVYCSITGFGQTGPYAARAGYDFLIQGLGGLMSVTGRRDSEPGGGPLKVGVALTDILTGVYASSAILAALAYRERSGVGQHIDLALLDVQVACLANQALSYLATGSVPRPLGNEHPSIVPYQDVPTRDGQMLLAIGNDDQFRRFCEATGLQALLREDRFATNPSRVVHHRELRERLAPAGAHLHLGADQLAGHHARQRPGLRRRVEALEAGGHVQPLGVEDGELLLHADGEVVAVLEGRPGRRKRLERVGDLGGLTHRRWHDTR